MCAAINSSTLILLFVSFQLVVLTDGLPLLRQKHGTQDDIIAGKDFLSIFMDLPAFRKSETTTNRPKTPPVTLPTSVQLEHYSGTFTPIIRESRSTDFASSIQKPIPNTLMPTQPISEINILKPNNYSDFSDSRKVVSVSISSSVAETHRIYSPKTSSTKEVVKMTTSTPRSDFDDAFFTSEDRQNFVAKTNRHDFSIEEPEPIIRNADVALAEELPANVQAIPAIKKLSDFEKTSELLKELSQEKLKDKLPPFHHTVIYHDNPSEQMAARSISYSTVIQSAPGESLMTRWRERSNKPDRSKSTQSSIPEYRFRDYDESLEKSREDTDWQSSETSTGTHIEPTEMNWGVQQKPYVSKQNLPIAYGQSEDNYEVDEAVSVQTNGRIHGIQPSQATENHDKPTAKSKNGYVIEGRKERRYRVEERTPDGFIVGEFGIVNRDDGLLRGVRYTAEETINPKLIYDTLMKFLSL